MQKIPREPQQISCSFAQKSCSLGCALFGWMALTATPLAPPHVHKEYIPFDGRDDRPFMSHPTFMALSDWIIDQNTPFFDPDWVNQGDIVYVDPSYIYWFEERVHDEIQCPYILISRVDEWLAKPGAMKKLIYDPKLSAWFCWNLLFSYHPKLHPIPMGQGVFAWTKDGPEQFLRRIKYPPFKQLFLYMNHCPRPFGDRDKLIPLFENKPYCYTRNRSNQPFKAISKNDYLDELAASYFVLSPTGYGIECWRTWEAIVLGCIPIVPHTFLDALYDDLPVLLVHDWTEINEDFLRKQYEKLHLRKTDKAYFPYWEKLILETKAKVKANDVSSSQPDKTLFSSQDLADLLFLLEDSPSLVYKGFLTSSRPEQFLRNNPALSIIYLDDPWSFSSDFPRIEQSNRSQSSPLFLDLTYFRSSLLKTEKFWEHSLKEDILELYAQLSPGTRLIGNMAHNEYVSKVLDRLSKELSEPIEIRGNFWVMTKGHLQNQ